MLLVTLERHQELMRKVSFRPHKALQPKHVDEVTAGAAVESECISRGGSRVLLMNSASFTSSEHQVSAWTSVSQAVNKTSQHGSLHGAGVTYMCLYFSYRQHPQKKTKSNNSLILFVSNKHFLCSV